MSILLDGIYKCVWYVLNVYVFFGVIFYIVLIYQNVICFKYFYMERCKFIVRRVVKVYIYSFYDY